MPRNFDLFRLPTLCACALACAGTLYLSGQTRTAGGSPAVTITSQRIETEIITVTPSGASPAQITRHAGVFFLAIANRTRDPNADITLVSVTLGSAVTGITDSAAFKRRGVSAGLADLAVGQYQLVYVPTNRVLCQITIR